MPVHPELAGLLQGLLRDARVHHRTVVGDARDGGVHPEALVVLREELAQPVVALLVEDEVLDVVQQVTGREHRAQGGGGVFVPGIVLAEPGVAREVFEHRAGEGAHAGVGEVREQHHGVGHEELRDLAAVGREVLREGRVEAHGGVLQLSHHQRDAVDEAHEVGTKVPRGARHRELSREHEVVLRGGVPVEIPQGVLRDGAVGGGVRALEAVDEQRVHLAVGVHQLHRGAVAGELAQRVVADLLGRVGVQHVERLTQPREEKDLALIRALGRERGAGGDGPPEGGEEVAEGVLDVELRDDRHRSLRGHQAVQTEALPHTEKSTGPVGGRQTPTMGKPSGCFVSVTERQPTFIAASRALGVVSVMASLGPNGCIARSPDCFGSGTGVYGAMMAKGLALFCTCRLQAGPCTAPFEPWWATLMTDSDSTSCD